MKTLIVILLAAGVACASTYFVVSTEKSAQLKQAQAAWDAEKAQLEAAAKTNVVSAQTVVVSAPSSVPAGESPEDILNDLLAVKLGSGEARNASLRFVVFKLESLAQHGVAAVPAIRSFIGRNVDVDYSAQDQNGADANVANGGNNQTNNNNGGGGSNRRFNGGGFGAGFAGGGNNFRGGRRGRNLQNLRTDWVSPPSLRLGLVGVLQEIGGPESEQALAEMLSSTARGVEVAYLARVLEEIAPGKYSTAACAAAKELLLNPPSVDNPDQFDQLSKSYLYGVLEMFHDASFAPNAEQMLVGADGRLDQDAMDYLNDVLKDQSVSALYAAYQNSGLTNQFDKMNLGREILNYVGQNAQANQLFTDTLNNKDLDSRTKAMMIVQQAGGGFGPFASDAPTDPQVISSRLNLLKQQESAFANDQTISQVIAMAENALQSGSQIQPQDMRQIFRGGGGFGGGGFGGGNNGGGANNSGNGNGQ